MMKVAKGYSLIICLLIITYLPWEKGSKLYGKGLGRETEIRTLFVEGNTLDKRPWTKLAKTDEKALALLIKMLGQSKTGGHILSLARKFARRRGKSLSQIIRPGEGSLTDTTLIRKFSSYDPTQVSYESRAVIYLNRGLEVKDGILDLAHELTHFALRRPFNPYRDHFNFLDFLSSTVEGRGGEVDAYLIECQVYKELYPTAFYNDSNCLKVYDRVEKKFSKKRGTAYFYQIGGYLSDFKEAMAAMKMSFEILPFISDAAPEFISSAYGLPYPVAAMKEFQSIMGKVCENDYRRLSYLKYKQQKGPAHERGKGDSWQFLNAALDKRCMGITNIEI